MGPLKAVEDTYNSLKDRISSPIFGPFVLAWLVANADAIILLLFDTDAIKSETFFTALKDNGNIRLWAGPILFGLIFLFSWDWIEGLVLKVKHPALKFKAEQQMRLDRVKEDLSLLDQLSKVKKDLEKLEENYILEKDKVTTLKSTLKANESTVSELEANIEKQKTVMQEKMGLIESLELNYTSLESKYDLLSSSVNYSITGMDKYFPCYYTSFGYALSKVKLLFELPTLVFLFDKSSTNDDMLRFFKWAFPDIDPSTFSVFNIIITSMKDIPFKEYWEINGLYGRAGGDVSDLVSNPRILVFNHKLSYKNFHRLPSKPDVAYKIVENIVDDLAISRDAIKTRTWEPSNS